MSETEMKTKSTAPWDQPRNATTVTVEMPNPLEATDAELLAALREQSSSGPLSEPAVEYVNFRNERDGRVCFCVSWRNRFAPRQ